MCGWVGGGGGGRRGGEMQDMMSEVVRCET